MSYQNLTLRNIAGEITAIFNDGTFRSLTPPDPRSGATAAFIGTAPSGISHEFFDHTTRSRTFQEFGADSEIAQMVQSAKEGDNALPIIVSRIGAKNYSFSLQRPIANGAKEKDDLIQIVPLFVQEDDASKGRENSLKSIKAIFLPFVEDSLVRQRVILGATRNSGDVTVLFDSERRIVTNGGAIFDVSIEVPVGEVLITNDALKSDDKLTFNDAGNTNSFEYDNDNARQTTINEKIIALSALNDLVDFNWDEAESLSTLAMTDVNSINMYETVIADVVKEFSGNVERINGKANGIVSNLSRRYAGVELAYKKLEYQNPGYIYCEGCYADVESVDIDALPNDLATMHNWFNKYLGNLWKYNIKGRDYLYMFARKDPFNAKNVVTTYTTTSNSKTLTFNFSEDQKKLGDLLNLVEVHFHQPVDASGALDPTAGDEAKDVETFVNKKGMIECHITLPVASANVYTDFFHLVTDGANTDLWEEEASPVRLRPSLTRSPATDETALNIDIDNDGTDESSDVLSVYLRDSDYQNTNKDWNNGNDPFVMTHYDLTGQFIPEAVTAKLLSFKETIETHTAQANNAGVLRANSDEVREISFLHQAAQAAFQASTNYSQTLAIVPTSSPDASDDGLNEWAGIAPEYEIDLTGELAVKTDGTGVLGTKLLCGSTSYRDGKAFGGIILTNGAKLPNKIPYGIDDKDEARDAFGQPIDLGKHCIVVGAWGFVANPQLMESAGRTGVSDSIHVNAGPRICGVLNSMPPGNEPIGPVNGVVPGFTPRYNSDRGRLNDLAFMRICMVDGLGVISSIYSSAHPTSDYRKISSTMSANAILGRLRSVCAPYIGRAYTDQEIASLSQTIDGVMKGMVSENYAQRIEVSLTASRFDRINGVLRASVTFIPPLSLEAINVEITLEAPTAGI